MKTLVVLSILFCVIALPALGELTDADLDKIRLIVKEEVKTEIAASETRTREYIDLKIDAVDEKLTARIDGVDKNLTARIDDIRVIMIALIGLVAAAIAIPQIIIAYRDRGRKELQTQQQAMQTEIDQLRKELEAMQNTPS